MVTALQGTAAAGVGGGGGWGEGGASGGLMSYTTFDVLLASCGFAIQ